MDAAESSAPMPTGSWPALSLHERRVLGVLIEKAKTTPDAYPMSINGLVTGCNQKSNRDPLLTLNDMHVEDTLEDLQKRGYVIRITGSGRVERWRHNLYEVWRVEKVELAILGELLLRGPQTEGELRGRASRMEPIADVDFLRQQLAPLRDRKLVVYLGPEDRRGAMLTHGFHAAEELKHLKVKLAQGAAPDADVPAPRQVHVPVAAEVRPAVDPRIEPALAEIASLKKSMSEMQALVSQLSERVKAIADGLGM